MSRGIIDTAKTVLVLCPHTDDEFGCAGTISRLIRKGADVHYMAFSRCEESVPNGFPKDILETECRKATRVLGIDENNIEILRYPVRNFPSFRQELLEKMVAIHRRLNPDLVLLPCSFDIHQDHQVINQEGIRAFKHSTIFGYELPQNITTFKNSAFVVIENKDIQIKINALSEYRSQTFRPYASKEFITSLAYLRGVQCGANYAEAFELIRLIER